MCCIEINYRSGLRRLKCCWNFELFCSIFLFSRGVTVGCKSANNSTSRTMTEWRESNINHWYLILILRELLFFHLSVTLFLRVARLYV